MLTLTTALPEPSVPYIDQLKTAKVSENLESASSIDTKAGAQDGSPVKSRKLRKDSLENLEADPWASPAVSKAQTNTVRNEATPSADAVTAAKPTRAGFGDVGRTTSAFTTNSDIQGGSDAIGNISGGGSASAEGSAGWGTAETRDQGLAAGFGTSGNGPNGPPGPRTVRSLGGGRTNTSSAVETVSVALLPEKEGIFLFQHHNYEVKSRRRGSAVTRRYSDFVWLLECLHRRYPFRQLPLLPPKRVAGKQDLILEAKGFLIMVQ